MRNLSKLILSMTLCLPALLCSGCPSNPPVVKPLSIQTASLPDAVVGEVYGVRFLAQGGNPPYHWVVVDGTLPVGIGLSDTGLLTGTPTELGTFSFVVRASDSTTLTVNLTIKGKTVEN